MTKIDFMQSVINLVCVYIVFLSILNQFINTKQDNKIGKGPSSI